MANDPVAPVIIKKNIIVEGGGHHGGAWKVAYADFVTAMMAFFLLMWLLNATTDKQKKGLSDYFSPAIPISKNSSGGEGQHWGDSVFAEDTLTKNGKGASLQFPTENHQAKGEMEKAAEKKSTSENDKEAHIREAEHLLEQLKARGGESMAQLEKMRHVITRLTDEGLVFEIHETPEIRLFDRGTGAPTDALTSAVRALVDASHSIASNMAINTYLAARPLIVVQNPVWEVSTDNAHKVRQEVERAGFPKDRIHRVTGYADRRPKEDNPMSIHNNRVEIIFLRDGA